MKSKIFFCLLFLAGIAWLAVTLNRYLAFNSSFETEQKLAISKAFLSNHHGKTIPNMYLIQRDELNEKHFQPALKQTIVSVVQSIKSGQAGEIQYSSFNFRRDHWFVGVTGQRLALLNSQPEYDEELLRILVTSVFYLVAFFGLAWFLAFALTQQLSRSIKQLTHLASVVASGKVERRYEKANNEFDPIGKAFNLLAEQLGILSHKLNGVHVGTSKLAPKKGTKSELGDSRILDSIHEGLIIIHPDLTVDQKFSKQAARLLQEENLANCDFIDLLESKSIASHNEIQSLKNACVMAFNLFVVEQFSDVFANVPNQLPIHLGDHSYLYRFNFSPVVENGEIVQIIVTFSDETSQQALHDVESFAANRFLDNIIQVSEMMENTWKREALLDFIEDNKRSLENILKVVDEDFDTNYVFRLLHTLKGAARALGLEPIAKVAHSAEGFIAIVRGGRRLSDHETTMLKTELMSMLDSLNAIKKLTAHEIEGQQLEQKNWEKRWMYFVEEIDQSMRDLASQLGKKIFIEWDTPSPMSDDDFKIFKNSVIHLLRNALDHGIEEPEQRMQKSKTSQGHISVTFSNISDNWIVRVADDGQGIDCGRLYQKACEKGIDVSPCDDWTNEDILHVLCHPGLSSRDTVSDISGRGVGMDSVLYDIKDAGGDLSLIDTNDLGTTFQMSWPSSNPESQAVLSVI